MEIESLLYVQVFAATSKIIGVTVNVVPQIALCRPLYTGMQNNDLSKLSPLMPFGDVLCIAKVWKIDFSLR